MTPTNTSYRGIRVVDMTTMIAAPAGTMILADLGADVIKVERPGGDDARRLPPFDDGTGTIYLAFNRNKRSVVLDATTDEGRSALLALIATADVFVENMRPGKAAKLGLSYEELSATNPGLVYCSVSGFGSGPLGRDLPGYDPVVQAFSGIMDATGYPDGGPARSAASIVDISTGMWSAIAIMAALARRDGDGHGSRIESSLVDSGLALMSHQILNLAATGRPPQRAGTAFAMAAPYEAFATADGSVLIAAGNNALFERLCVALGVDALIGDERFQSVHSRLDHRDALHELLEAQTASWTAAELEVALQDAGVAASAINRLDTTLAHPLTAEREMVVDLPPSPQGTGRCHVRLPFAPVPEELRWAPALGEHTAEVLAELGLAGPLPA